MKKVVFLIKVMRMGGAERIMSALANYCSAHGWDTTVILTHQSIKEANLSRLNNGISVISLEDEIRDRPTHKAVPVLQMLQARLVGKTKKLFGQSAEDVASIKKYYSRNYEKVCWLKEYFRKNADASQVAFLYDSIFLTLLSATKTNRLIISDRGDPGQSLSSRTDMAFFRRMFPKADAMVFQSPGVQEWYRNNIGIDGTVIFNPIKDDLPLPYNGERKKRIVNFCRIDPQKNLFVLLEAYEMLAKEYPEYELYIFGDTSDSAKEYGKCFFDAVSQSAYSERIHILPARADIHQEIINYSMFVSSSDFEGMSNSMLEAMAIGLPTICTDCPAGGARAVIRDHENGLLVPVRDAEALYKAMKEVIEDPELAKTISMNGRKIRETQSSEVIMEKWEKIING